MTCLLFQQRFETAAAIKHPQDCDSFICHCEKRSSRDVGSPQFAAQGESRRGWCHGTTRRQAGRSSPSRHRQRRQLDPDPRSARCTGTGPPVDLPHLPNISSSRSFFGGSLAQSHELCSDLGAAQQCRWTSFCVVVGLYDLGSQPGFEGTVSRLQRAKTVADDFAFRCIFSRGYFVAYHLSHFLGQRDAELLCRSHGDTSEVQWDEAGFNPIRRTC